MTRIENESELPEPPEGKVRVIDDADLNNIEMDSGGGFEAVITVNECHFEDVEEFKRFQSGKLPEEESIGFNPDRETIEFPVEEFRLLVDLAGVARNPRLHANVAPYIGGAARASAARLSHDKARRVLLEAGSE